MPHSPGPWKADWDHAYVIHDPNPVPVVPIRAANGDLVCEIRYPDQVHSKDNAHIIEAALDLRDAGKALLLHSGPCDICYEDACDPRCDCPCHKERLAAKDKAEMAVMKSEGRSA